MSAAVGGVAESPLRGVGVLLTRARAQAEPIAAALARAGADVIVFPTLDIVAQPLDAAGAAALVRLPEASLAIFVSANAFEHGMASVRAHLGAWPGGVRVATVGQATAERMREAGFREVIAPAEHFDSESLLAMLPDELVAGRRVLIFRGVGGRELLRQSLEARGARVDYVECYRRVRPDADARPVREAVASGRLAAVQALSAESLDNLLAMAGTDLPWKQVTLVVSHPAVARCPSASLFGQARVTDAGAEGLVQALSRQGRYG